MLEIIAGIDDNGQLVGSQILGESMRQFGAADPAGKGDDPAVEDGRSTVDGHIKTRLWNSKLDLRQWIFSDPKAIDGMRGAVWQVPVLVDQLFPLNSCHSHISGEILASDRQQFRSMIGEPCPGTGFVQDHFDLWILPQCLTIQM